MKQEVAVREQLKNFSTFCFRSFNIKIIAIIN